MVMTKLTQPERRKQDRRCFTNWPVHWHFDYGRNALLLLKCSAIPVGHCSVSETRIITAHYGLNELF